MNDKELSVVIAGCVANKRKAQQQLYLLFYQRMWRLCMRYLRVDDLVPEALNAGFLKVFTNIKTYHNEKGNLENWVAAIMIRCCIDLQRSEMRFQYHDDITETDNVMPISPDALNNLYAADLLRYIRELPPASQAVFNLYEVDGFDHAEIAAMLNITESTSRWHLSSAKKTLRQELIKNSRDHERTNVAKTALT
ncbi:RNA polymerase sigma factor [Mucilaginibacter calamicampi]|uniref:RNA polymerase sigma factor n=1 Tax=Mucilaginibacter calamicampi TaxID=1302352 RepID=A0ABW2YYE8_9SPHI